ncbi:MAG: nicotinate-nucleotide adenylyltransferase [Chloroflexi bacterium]|nr:nicotinate-nucleotide adenylyltransferase [Chloroflexota bacterium]
MTQKLGILGGTFDPVHLGHLIMAQEAQRLLILERILFVPAGQPWLKASRSITSAQHRLEMLRRALASNPTFQLLTLEIDRLGPSYTVDTLVQLRRELGDEVELYFILGQDALADLSRWHRPRQLLELCYLVAMPRPGAATLDMECLEAALPGLKKKVIYLEKAHQVSISASEIRERVACGEEISHLVPEAVAEYIKEKGLYLMP